MAEYIEKKTAVEFFETLQNGTLKDGNTAAAAVWKLAAGIVKRLPKAEVVPVVHCKGCAHSTEVFGRLVCSHSIYTKCTVREDFFCADGVKAEVGND